MNAFELIVLRYKDPIFSFSYHFLADYHRAQDISQETFLRVLKNAKRYKSRNNFKTWLYTIAGNLCKNELRNRNRHKAESLDDPGLNMETLRNNFYDPPDSEYENMEMGKIIRDAISSLPEDQRMAIVMREYQGMNYEEIASTLNCSLGAVKSKIYRARQNLKKILLEANILSEER